MISQFTSGGDHQIRRLRKRRRTSGEDNCSAVVSLALRPEARVCCYYSVQEVEVPVNMCSYRAAVFDSLHEQRKLRLDVMIKAHVIENQRPDVTHPTTTPDHVDADAGVSNRTFNVSHTSSWDYKIGKSIDAACEMLNATAQAAPAAILPSPPLLIEQCAAILAEAAATAVCHDLQENEHGKGGETIEIEVCVTSAHGGDTLYLDKGLCARLVLRVVDKCPSISPNANDIGSTSTKPRVTWESVKLTIPGFLVPVRMVTQCDLVSAPAARFVSLSVTADFGSRVEAMLRPYGSSIRMAKAIQDVVEDVTNGVEFQTVEQLAQYTARVCADMFDGRSGWCEAVTVDAVVPYLEIYGSSCYSAHARIENALEINNTNNIRHQQQQRLQQNDQGHSESRHSGSGPRLLYLGGPGSLHRVFVAVGSNLGNPASNIDAGLSGINAMRNTRIVDTSYMYATAPELVTDQPEFLNAVVEIETELSPEELLHGLKKIESDLHLHRENETNSDRQQQQQQQRQNRHQKYGPRNLDFDILFYDDIVTTVQVTSNDTSTAADVDDNDGDIVDGCCGGAPQGSVLIPHHGIADRQFVLVPLCDIAPHFVHPVHGCTVEALLCRLVRNKGRSDEEIRVDGEYGSSGQKVYEALGVRRVTPLRRARRNLVWGGQTYVMGITNVTPDSFSDGNCNFVPEVAIRNTVGMVESGADMIDIGGQSTRPGATRVPPREELRRVVPVVSGIRQKLGDQNVVLSIDTFYASVARATVEAGIDIINDVTGGRGCEEDGDDDTVSAARDLRVPIVLMHMRGTPENMSSMTNYGNNSSSSSSSSSSNNSDGGMQQHQHQQQQQQTPLSVFWANFQDELSSVVQKALDRGIFRWDVIVDVGIGFAKTKDQCSELVRRHRLINRRPRLSDGRRNVMFNMPSLLGLSRKSFLCSGYRVGAPRDRDGITAASGMVGSYNDVDIFRVHNVAATVPVLRLADNLFRCMCRSHALRRPCHHCYMPQR